MPNGARSAFKSRSNGLLLDRAADFVSAHDEVIVIAPSHSAGEELAHRTSGISGVHRLTFQQFAADLARPAMAATGLAPLTPLGLEAVSARVSHRSLVENELDYFKDVAGMPGFARALARTLQELRLARVGPKKLATAGESGRDLTRLLARYEDELDLQRLADLARIFSLAADVKHHRWLGLPILRLDAPLETASHREFFETVASKAPAVLELELDNEPRPQEAGTALDRLRAYLFHSCPKQSAPEQKSFDIFSAPGEGLEAVEIARRILRLAREGVPFDQVAILLRSPERYQPMVEEALRRARIPAYFSRGTARPDPAGRAFLALLACANEKCSASRFAEYLSLGQVPPEGFQPAAKWVAPDDTTLAEPQEAEAEQPVDESKVPRAPSAWEKLLVDASVIGGRERWKRRLAGLDREFELRLKAVERDDATRREHVQRQLDHLRQLEKFALPLIDLLHDLPKAALWRDWIAELGKLARVALRRPDAVLAVLAEFEPMADVGPAALDEVMEVLSERLRFLRRDPPQRRYGQVFVGSIDEARGREFGTVFLPGLAEGLFPQRALEDPLLLDEFRRVVEQALPLRDNRVDDERTRLRLAVAAARDRLVASYPRMDVAESRPRVPSFYALELPRAVDGELPELKKFEERCRDAAPARLNWPAPAVAEDAIDETEYDLVTLKSTKKARYLVEVNESLARSLRGRWKRWSGKWCDVDGLIATDGPALDALGGYRLHARPWSPSSLQNFAACPYKFALYGIFGLRPRDEAAPLEQLDPLTRGALFHEVQFSILSELRTRGALPVNRVNLEEALRVANAELDRVAEKYREDLAPAIPRVWSTQIEDLRTDLRGWLQHIAFNDDDWLPVHFEFAFGMPHDAARDPASTESLADLDAVLLRGSIDLVERHTMTGLYRVTDHKTGKPPETIPAISSAAAVRARGGKVAWCEG
jgi:hypothetical protein